MGKVWVLDTETKGTGANMVPLDRVHERSSSKPVAHFRLPARKPPAAGSPPARTPLRFRLVDVMTREVLADDADLRAALKLLDDVRSIVDVTVYVFNATAGDWRMLTLGETRMLWDRRGTA